MKKEKICLNCGRSFEWRKKWENCWSEVKYCSKKCKSGSDKSFLKERILELLQNRTGSICPSDVLSSEDKQNKEKMEEVRRATRLLVHENKIEITQKGKVVDPSSFKGPIRLRLKA